MEEGKGGRKRERGESGGKRGNACEGAPHIGKVGGESRGEQTHPTLRRPDRRTRFTGGDRKGVKWVGRGKGGKEEGKGGGRRERGECM